jgi:hypothetical protein
MFRTTYDDRTKVVPPDWYNIEGTILRCYRAVDTVSNPENNNIPGLLAWFDIVPDSLGSDTGICKVYITLTGNITYDSKTGRPLYNNVTNYVY